MRGCSPSFLVEAGGAPAERADLTGTPKTDEEKETEKDSPISRRFAAETIGWAHPKLIATPEPYVHKDYQTIFVDPQTKLQCRGKKQGWRLLEA